MSLRSAPWRGIGRRPHAWKSHGVDGRTAKPTGDPGDSHQVVRPMLWPTMAHPHQYVLPSVVKKPPSQYSEHQAGIFYSFRPYLRS